MVGQYRISGSGATEIAASVEAGVAAGALPPGALLPPVRVLAGRLGVSAGTVAAAYRLLRDRAIVATDGRRGTSVRARPSTAARSTQRVVVPEGVRDLASGNPDPRLLPPLGRALRAVAGDDRALYGGPDLLPALAGTGSAWLRADRVPVETLVATSGALDGIERVLEAWLRPGDAVAVEDPGWSSLLDLVGALGLTPVPVRVDAEGPLVADVAAAPRRGARALVLTNRAQNPTGAALSAARARALRQVLAGQPELLVVEDDHAADVAGAPPQTVAGATGRWAFVRSMAKAYGPDLRVALLTGDATTVGRVQGRLRLGPGWVSHLLQGVAAHLLDDEATSALVARAEADYAARRTGLVAALAGLGVAAGGASGINVWVPTPDETATVTSLLRSGWAVTPGARFRLSSPPAVRVTVSGLAAREVAPLAQALAAAVHPGAGGRRTDG